MQTFSFTRKKLEKAKLLIIDQGNVPTLTSLGEFFINPSTWTEVKTSNWIKHMVPGTSDPHQQWTSGGARTITFEALVTNDTVEGHVKNNSKNTVSIDKGKGKPSLIKKIGTIASQVFNISGLDVNSVAAINNSSGLDLDITAKLNYYRSLCYPRTPYARDRVSGPPPFVRLIVGSTFGKRTSATSKFVVDSVNISITKQYPNLTPIEARVTFTITEFVDGLIGVGTINGDK